MTQPDPDNSLRLALDQNFPTPLLDAIKEWLPAEVALEHIARIDDRLSDLDDDELLVTLREWGYDGLVTNNYKMLEVPHELVAVVATKLVVVALVEMGHDPIRATGALLLELPGLPSRLRSRDNANVFYLNYSRRRPETGWTHLQRLAEKQGATAADLYRQLKDHVPAPLPAVP